MVNEIDRTLQNEPSNLPELLEAIIQIKKNNPKIKVPEIDSLQKAYLEATKELVECEKLGIEVLNKNDNSFPFRLNMIPDPPLLLYVKGNIEALNNLFTVAIIGTREPSEFGRRCGQLFGEFFADKNYVVISGLAKGIDTTGHEGCLTKNGITIAVLAQGLDTPVYPKENRALADKILQNNGCLVSEYGLGKRGQPSYFIERDRIQSGLSDGVIVIETDIRGGTMHTVQYSVKYKKPLGCLNHPEKFKINNPKALGNELLISNNTAVPLFDVNDLNSFIFKMKESSSLNILNKTDTNQDDIKSSEQLSLFEE